MAAWLDLYGYRVTLIDADWQQQSSEWLHEVAPQIPTQVIQDPNEIVKTIPKLLPKFEGVIIDGPAGLDETAGAVLTVSDVVLIPCGPNSAEVKALKMVASELKEIQQYRKQKEGNEAPFAFIIPVRTNPRWNSTKILLAEASKLGFYHLPAYVPFRQIYANLSGMPGTPARLLWQLGRSKQIKEAVMDLDKLFQEMFPEVAERNPKLMADLMQIPSKKVTNKRRIAKPKERNGPGKKVVNG